MTCGLIVDVSQFNGRIDYARLAAAGVVAAYERALVGFGTKDTALYEHANGFRSVGLPFGVYGDDFPRHAKPQDADRQADQLADLSHEVGATLVPMIDVEPEGVALVTGGEWAASVEAYVAGLERRFGRSPLAYTGPVFWSAFRELRSCAAASRCLLWLAAYTDEMPLAPEPWTSVMFVFLWQAGYLCRKGPERDDDAVPRG